MRLAAVPSFLAGCLPGSSWSGALLIIGFLAFWATVVMASDMGFRVWQSMPDAASEAFSDASASGSLTFWMASRWHFLLNSNWLCPWGKMALALGESRAFYPAVTKSVSPTTQTGNRYQGPNAGEQCGAHESGLTRAS